MRDRKSADRFIRLRGHAGKGMTTDEVMTLTRGESNPAKRRPNRNAS